MGGVSSFRKVVFEKTKFSEYFEGYGLYEDADFSIRVSRLGSNYINTSAKLYHYHAVEGRPDKFKYGKMVIRNGWYVWRVKYTQPSFKSRFKWNCTALLLIIIRFSNIVTTNKRKEAFSESLGRVYGILSLIFNKPVIEVN
jgi:GT2 family glycosyltransferase